MLLVAELFGWKTTATDVALVGAIAALAAAIASPLSTFLVARSQRKSDQANRIYKDKATAYHDIASDAYNGRELVAECAEQLAKAGATDADAKVLVDALDAAVSALNKGEPAIIAQMTIVAPEKVVVAREDFVDAWNHATTKLFYEADRTAPGFAAVAKKLTEGADPILAPALRNLRKKMRDDLCL